MSAIINIDNAHAALPPLSVAHRANPPAESGSPEIAEDRVELSSAGQALARVAGQPSDRMARIELIRAEISAGTYETPERIAGTVARLLDVVG